MNESVTIVSVRMAVHIETETAEFKPEMHIHLFSFVHCHDATFYKNEATQRHFPWFLYRVIRRLNGHCF